MTSEYYREDDSFNEHCPGRKFLVKITILWVCLAIFMAICMIGGASAATCNTTDNWINSTSISDGCTLDVAGTYTMSGETFHLNGTLGGGAINITSGSVNLNCNGSSLIGNNTDNSMGFNLNGAYNSVNLTNCIIHNYTIGINLKTGDNAIIKNITFYDNNYSMKIQTDSASHDIIDSFFYNSKNRGIWISNSDDMNITNDIFNNSGRLTMNGATGSKGFVYSDSSVDRVRIESCIFSDLKGEYIRVAGTDNVLIYNKLIGDLGTYATYGVYLDSGTGTNVSYNNFTMFQYPIYTIAPVSSVRFFENNIYNVDTGGRLGGNSIYYYNNTVKNTTMNFDSYNLGLKVMDGNSIYIWENNFTEVITGVTMINGTNVEFLRNTVSGISNNQRSNYLASSTKDPDSAIRITTTYKSWVTESKDPAVGSLTTLNPYRSNNVTIEDNVISNFNVLLWIEGATNITHDITGTYRKSAFPNDLYTQEEFCILSGFTNITGYNSGIQTVFSKGYKSVFQINWSLFDDYEYYKNVNSTANKTVGKYNQSNSLLYNSTNSICSGSSSNIANNDGNINITLQPNEACYVLDNFNLTEGVTRENSPIWINERINESKRTTYHLASNLTVAISEIGFYPAGVPCAKKVLFISASGEESVPNFTCSGGYVSEVIIEDYEPSSSSDELLLSYTGLINPFDLHAILLEDVAGTTEILAFILLIIVSIGMGYYNMPNKIALALYALLFVIMANYFNPLFVFVTILTGIASFYAIGKIAR